ncbi:ead/Ea22-like family protein [Escherichia coli]|nr:ead/Ea22-like family protein [Escherichia coli]
MSKIDYQALREIAKQATQGEWVAFISSGTGTYAVHTPGDKRCEDVIKWTGFDGQNNAENNARYIAAFNPEVVQALLDERERNQQYIKSRDQENEDIALTVGKLRVELEVAKKRIAELEAEPVSQTYKSQHTQFEQVADLYEMQFDDGRTCAFHTDAQKAAQWLQACDGNRVQEYVKLERLRNALSGNYPVTPDGWISCSDRMPDKLIPVMVMYEDGEMWSAMWNGNRWDDGTEYPDPHSVTHWREMPAAPKQEVKS